METTPTPASPALTTLLGDLDAAERGYILGLLLSASVSESADDEAVHTGLAGPPAGRCAEVAAAIGRLPRPERLRLVNLLAREALAPTPAGLENVHPDTLRELLQGESDAVVTMVAARGPSVMRQVAADTVAARRRSGSAGFALEEEEEDQAWVATASPDAVVELLRAILAPVVAVPAANSRRQHDGRLARHLANLSPAALLAEVTAAGAALLGTSLRGAGDDTLRRAVAHVGAPWGAQIMQAAAVACSAEPATPPPPTPDLSSLEDRARARHLVATTAPGDSPLHTLQRLGARALVDHLRDEDADVVLSVAQRLPQALARLLSPSR